MKTKQERQIDSFNKDVQKIRSEIPKQYNKVLLLDEILNPDIDLFISITTRGDGKTYGYFKALLTLAMKYEDFSFMAVARHYTLRNAYAIMIEQIMYDNKMASDSLIIRRKDHYIEILANQKSIAIITDLMAATDLKYHSAVLRHYRFIVYDEFLAIEGDYLPDEPERLKTIYESVDRGTNSLLPNPKLLLIGNPVNYNSPLLSYFNLFDNLDNQEMNTVKRFDNVLIERFRNESINEVKNNRLFSKTNNSSITGEFKRNTALVITTALKKTMPYSFTIKLSGTTNLIVHYSTARDYYLSVNDIPNTEYEYCTDMLDYKKGVRLLDKYDYSPFNEDDYTEHRVLFADTFSIGFFDRVPKIKQLSIKELITEQINQHSHDSDFEKQKIVDHNTADVIEENRLNQLKKKLFRDYFK